MIEKKMVIRRIGTAYSYQGFVREPSEDPDKENKWIEATSVLTVEAVRPSAPESEVKDYCMRQVDLYLLQDKNFPVSEEEEIYE